MTLAEELAKAKADIANGVEDCPWCLFWGQDAHSGNGSMLPDFLAAFDRAITEASKPDPRDEWRMLL